MCHRRINSRKEVEADIVVISVAFVVPSNRIMLKILANEMFVVNLQGNFARWLDKCNKQLLIFSFTSLIPIVISIYLIHLCIRVYLLENSSLNIHHGQAWRSHVYRMSGQLQSNLVVHSMLFARSHISLKIQKLHFRQKRNKKFDRKKIRISDFMLKRSRLSRVPLNRLRDGTISIECARVLRSRSSISDCYLRFHDKT